MNDYLDEILAILNTLVCDHGAYQVNLDLSNANMTLRFVDNPFSCRLYGVNEILHRPFSLTYPRQTYLAYAKLSQDTVSMVLGHFAVLRLNDEQRFLTEASLNIIDGQVGVTMSDSESYYISANEFLSESLPPSTTIGDRYGT